MDHHLPCGVWRSQDHPLFRGPEDLLGGPGPALIPSLSCFVWPWREASRLPEVVVGAQLILPTPKVVDVGHILAVAMTGKLFWLQ